jgi:hypothetical protein
LEAVVTQTSVASLRAKERLTWTLAQLEKIADAFEAKGSFWPLLFFFPAYLVLTVITARRKLLWDDEFFTLYLSRPNTMHGILEGLKTGADQHPPLFYYFIHQITALFGLSHLTLRLLPMLGFGLMCVCLFYLLRNRTSVLWAFLGMLMPLTSSAIYYASEARGYGGMLGFCALALLAWQRLTSSRRRRVLWLCTLFFASALAVSSHYYAVMFFFALGLGEIARTIQLRRIDIWIWLALFGAAIPPLVFLSIIRSANSYSAHFWAIPIWGSLLDFYPGILGGLANILILGAIPFLIAALRSESYEETGGKRIIRHFSTYEVIAWGCITAVPFFVMVLAKTVTHGYTERYAITGMIGAIVVLCHFGFSITPRPRSFPLLLSCAAMLYFITHGIWTIRIIGLNTNRLSSQMHLLDMHASSPLALSDLTIFHQVSYYSPRKLIQNVAFVADPESSVRYILQDTVDRGLLDLRPWFPLQIIPSRTFFAQHREFLVYTYIGSWSWLTYDLIPPRYDTRVLDRYDSDILLSVRRVSDTPEAQDADLDSAQPTDDLFHKISSTGPSLCKQWMPHDSECDRIERLRVKAALRPKPSNKLIELHR